LSGKGVVKRGLRKGEKKNKSLRAGKRGSGGLKLARPLTGGSLENPLTKNHRKRVHRKVFRRIELKKR